MEDRIYLNPPHISQEELKPQLDQLFSENWIAPIGPQLGSFERGLSILHHEKPVLALNSGTASLHLAYLLLGLKRGDHVIVQSHTHIATVNALSYIGAIPVFVDSEWDTLNMDPQFLVQAIEDLRQQGKNPKAVVVVNIYGKPAKWNEIRQICDQLGIPIIEDAAESLGSIYDGNACGTFGDLGILSFNGNKIITTGGGGALICKTDSQYQQALKWSTQSRENFKYFEHRELGYNYRLSNVLAAVGIAELKTLNFKLERKKEIHNWYCDLLSDYSLNIHSYKDLGSKENYWLNILILDSPKLAKSILQDFENANIEARPLWKPMHLQPLYSNSGYYGSSHSQTMFENAICLPSGTSLTARHFTRIADSISKSLKK